MRRVSCAGGHTSDCFSCVRCCGKQILETTASGKGHVVVRPRTSVVSLIASFFIIDTRVVQRFYMTSLSSWIELLGRGNPASYQKLEKTSDLILNWFMHFPKARTNSHLSSSCCMLCYEAAVSQSVNRIFGSAPGTFKVTTDSGQSSSCDRKSVYLCNHQKLQPFRS